MAKAEAKVKAEVEDKAPGGLFVALERLERGNGFVEPGERLWLSAEQAAPLVELGRVRSFDSGLRPSAQDDNRGFAVSAQDDKGQESGVRGQGAD